MKIGIIVFSNTGNTYSVANKLMEKLLQKRHSVKLEKLEPKGKVHPGIKNVELKNIPDIKSYDIVIFGGPVWAFSLSPVLKTFMDKLLSLENKKVICFVTKAVPFNWTGGNNAIAQMVKICKSKGTMPLLTNIINWSKKRDEQIEKFINNTMQILN